jgi:glycine C-acetyltransferase/8-amino-7-oxononanoate synthase
MPFEMQSPAGAVTVINSRRCDYFCGCGYLGLQGDPRVNAAASEALAQYGLSTATSRGGYGEHPVYNELEKHACAFFGFERLLYFASGYMGASILVQADLHAHDHFFIDESAHFSLWDAAALSNRPTTPLKHLNPASLAEKLRTELQSGARPILLTDGLFPISGEIAPLLQYLELLRPLHGHLIVDDAHAVGVLGDTGRGSLAHFGIDDPACQSTATFNKALGGFGGFIYGKKKTLDRIEQNSRILIGSSPPPLPAAAASAEALRVIHESPKLLEDLRRNIHQARTGLNELGWDLPDSPSPILCLPGRTGVDLLKIRNELFAAGIAVEYVTNYPSTPAGGAIRLAIFASHSPAQIDRLLLEMKHILIGK